MKKITIKLTAALLSLVFMFSGMFSLLISADETEPATCVKDHFSNLNSLSGAYVPPNVIGSCPYVAMSMLLSFYDSYWDDDFIVEDLDWDSGIFDSSTETLSASSEYQSWIDWKTTHPDTDFIDYELANQSEFLQPYLISLGRFAGYHSNIEENGYGLSPQEVINFLKSYLYNVRGFTEEQIQVCYKAECIFGATQSEVNQAVIEQISKGFPVIYRGFTINLDNGIDSLDDLLNIKQGHVMLAYDTSDEQNYEDRTIFLHKGYNGSPASELSNPYTTVEDTEYQYVNIAIWLEINEDLLPHNCSNNYYDSATNSYVCACNVYYESHASHTHFHYDSYDSVSHFGECICGNTIESAPHNLRYSGIGAMNHFERCVGCNYKATVGHSYVEFTINSNGHRGTCSCGWTGEIEEHYDHHYARKDTTTHRIYCECGWYMGTSYHVVPAVGNGFFRLCIHCGERVNIGEVLLPTPGPGIQSASQITYITDAGSYVDGDGIIYLVESDMSLYLAGELDIYSLVNNNGDSLN